MSEKMWRMETWAMLTSRQGPIVLMTVWLGRLLSLWSRPVWRPCRMYGQSTSWAELSSMAVRVELTGEWAELCSTCPLEL